MTNDATLCSLTEKVRLTPLALHSDINCEIGKMIIRRHDPLTFIGIAHKIDPPGLLQNIFSKVEKEGDIIKKTKSEMKYTCTVRAMRNRRFLY